MVDGSIAAKLRNRLDGSVATSNNSLTNSGSRDTCLVIYNLTTTLTRNASSSNVRLFSETTKPIFTKILVAYSSISSKS